jgi:hypothetical protein
MRGTEKPGHRYLTDTGNILRVGWGRIAAATICLIVMSIMI